MSNEVLTPMLAGDDSFLWAVNEDERYPVRLAFQRFGTAAMETVSLDSRQVKVLNLIAQCKTGELGYNAAYCPTCDKYVVHACSCNNRECPNCQSILEEAWIEERSREAIPGISYFHIVMTIPAEMVELFRHNKEQLYPVLASAASRTVVEQAQGLRHNGFTPGVITVTHPGGSKMNFRPHTHMIVSGGGLTRFGQFRTTSRKEFFLPLNQLAAGFRGRFLSQVKKLYREGNLFLPDSLVDPSDPFGFQAFIDSMFQKKWLPFIKETFVGNGADTHGKSKGNAIRYLARYLFRTGISNHRITQVTDTEVCFTYKDYKNGGAVTPTSLSGPDFVAAFLNLIMPAHCPKVRYYGIMANCSKNRCLKLVFQLLNSVFTPVKLHGNGISTSAVVMSIHSVDIDLCPWCKKTHMLRMPRITIPIYRPSRERVQQYIEQRRKTLFPST